jgi:hypothetical protein
LLDIPEDSSSNLGIEKTTKLIFFSTGDIELPSNESVNLQSNIKN